MLLCIFELDDVCFLFETYELTPRSEGKPVFRFPKAEIQKFLLNKNCIILTNSYDLGTYIVGA